MNSSSMGVLPAGAAQHACCPNLLQTLQALHGRCSTAPLRPAQQLALRSCPMPAGPCCGHTSCADSRSAAAACLDWQSLNAAESPLLHRTSALATAGRRSWPFGQHCGSAPTSSFSCSCHGPPGGPVGPLCTRTPTASTSTLPCHAGQLLPCLAAPCRLALRDCLIGSSARASYAPSGMMEPPRCGT